MTKTYTFDVLEADDGSGDAIIQFTDEFIAEMGWKEGTTLNLRVEETPTGNVIIMTEVKNEPN
jgi:hypothetical protein